MSLEFSSQELVSLHTSLAKLRLKADLTLLPKYPYFASKPYPLGRCKEIRDEVQRLLLMEFSKTECPAIRKIASYVQRGGVVHKAWGSLRDEYFQNAMLVDKWYLDVSNDTVHPNKPRVEVMLLADARFTQITSFELFAQIARSYWQVEIYANTVLPALAPYFPLICVNAAGASWLAAANDDMLAVAVGSQFTLSERIMRAEAPAPGVVLRAWLTMLEPLRHQSPFYAQDADSLSYCQRYRESQSGLSIAQRNDAVVAFSKLPSSVTIKS
ncbi:hypothetical protein ACFOEE_04470 [Pseudoalteromonas fenneropenaei]|uniref:DUF3025 domain-containing protein n=1 Tax=Pseudoalteromonas fenneropenaei TaxID=1737459 RepID=A0ABV7CGX9_9GAMM